MRRSAYLSDRQLSRKRDGKHQTVEPVLASSHNVRHLQTNERQNTLVLTSVVVYTRIYRALRKYSHPRPSLTVCTFCHVTPRNGESFNSFFLNAKYMARLWLLLEETYLAKIKDEVKRRLIREATKAPMVNAEYDAATTIYFNTDLVISHSCGVFFFLSLLLQISQIIPCYDCAVTAEPILNGISWYLNAHLNASWALIAVTHLFGVTLIAEVLQHPDTRHTHPWLHLRLRGTARARVLSRWLQLHFLTRRVARLCLSWGIMGLLGIIRTEER